MDGVPLLLFFLGCILTVSAQTPGFGGCPDKNVPMPDFDLSKYLGVWHEAERSFTVLEAGSRCVRTNYTQTIDGKVHVENEATNRLTGLKRVLLGEMKSAGKAGEGKINIKYSIPIPLETTYHVLKTDYDTYSVIWYCQSFGLFNAQYAWIMTRERQPPGPVLQSAYGVLDEFDIPRQFFVKTDQKECDIVAATPDIIPSNPDPARTAAVSQVKTPSNEMMPPEPVVEENIKESSDDKPSSSSIVMEDAQPIPNKDAEMPAEKNDEKENVLPEKTAEPTAEKLSVPANVKDEKLSDKKEM